MFGALRVAGTVIWATDLIERKTKSSGGKGRPSTTNYSYTANIAVALSSRPLARIGRIWADGNLLRGAAGDFKVQTKFRFYDGYGDQPIDPLIASAEGAGNTAAHRGLAYVVFEDLHLADFGNRIPSLTFEIFEREGPVHVVDIARAVSAGLITGTSNETVAGYAVEGSNARTALGPLLSAMPVLLCARGSALELHDWWELAPSTAITPAQNIGQTSYDPPTRHKLSASKIPSSLSVRHYEPLRDYQIGVQSSQRSGQGRSAIEIDAPISIDAGGAKRLADLQLLQYQRNQSSWTGHVLLDENALRSGDWILDEARKERWRVTEIEHLRGVNRIVASQMLDTNPGAIVGTDPGRNVGAPDIAAGVTRLVLVDLPVFDNQDYGKPIIAAAAAGTGLGWRGAALSVQQGTGLLDIGVTATSAVMGSATNVLLPHSPYFIDNRNLLEISLLHDAMELPVGSGDPTTSDSALCLVGGEFLRYGRADYIGNNRYRLSALLRGCYSTESAASAHGVGDQFLLLDRSSLRVIDEVPLLAGQQLVMEALGIGDVAPALATTLVAGRAITPLAPVHLTTCDGPNGGFELHWIRRSRIDFGWHDAVDQPLIEDGELYGVDLFVNGNLVQSWQIAEPHLAITQGQVSAWNLPANSILGFEIRQIGRFARSAAAHISINLTG